LISIRRRLGAAVDATPEMEATTMVFRGPLRHDPLNSQSRTATDQGIVPVGRRLVLVALAGLLALALSACGSGEASEAPQAAADNNGGPTVTIQDMAYTPATLTVEIGATVTWVWRDGAIAHDVKGDGFKSKVMAEGTFSHRFTRPGTYRYVCTLHPNMTGTIEVTG
jgi:plastocyanin